MSLGIKKSSGCECSRFLSTSCFAQAEQRRDKVVIEQRKEDKQSWESQFICRCTACLQRFSVHEFEAGMGRRSRWQLLQQ